MRLPPRGVSSIGFWDPRTRQTSLRRFEFGLVRSVAHWGQTGASCVGFKVLCIPRCIWVAAVGGLSELSTTRHVSERREH